MEPRARPKKPVDNEIKEAAMEIQLLLLDGVDTDEQLHSSAGDFSLKSESNSFRVGETSC